VSAPQELDDEALVALFPGEPVSHDSAAHYRGRAAQRLLVNRCAACGHWHHPPRPLCPACHSWDVVATEVSGRGTIHLMTRLRQGAPASGVDYTGGYPVVAVELEEQPGLRFTSTLIGEGDIGTMVRLAWRRRGRAPLPVFEPTPATQA
jgi:uncharacterized OB-fold protein